MDIGLIIAALLMAAQSPDPGTQLDLSCRATVPARFDSEAPSPGVGTVRDRYVWAYEAFCWNCVQVRSGDLEARCPFMCSGNDSATAGCRDGSQAATLAIDEMLASSGPELVQGDLRRLAANPEGRKKAKRYFPDGPAAERP